MGDFNSRLYTQLAGEQLIIGQYFFKNQDTLLTTKLNRFLLLEFCAAASLQIASTFFNQPSDKLVTYRELVTRPMDIITPSRFAQLDLVLIEQKWASKILDIESCRSIPLASHHCLVLCHLDVDFPKIKNPMVFLKKPPGPVDVP